MAQIQITIQEAAFKEKPLSILTFNGQLDETNVDLEAKQIYNVIEKMENPRLVLDLSGLEYMNSKSIGYLTDWYTRVMAKNGRIVIARPRSNILDILKVVGITQIISVYDNLLEAQSAVFTSEASTEIK